MLELAVAAIGLLFITIVLALPGRATEGPVIVIQPRENTGCLAGLVILLVGVVMVLAVLLMQAV